MTDTHTERITLSQFISKHNLKFTSHEVTSRPDSLMDDSAYHFKCWIVNGRRGHTLYFSMGSGHAGKTPEFADVLDCLGSDASGYENARSFDDWASEYGYDTDSRKAERIWRAVKRQSEQLKRTLGAEAYEELLWNTERE